MSTNGIPSYAAIQKVHAAGEAERGPGPEQVAEEREAERAEIVGLLRDLNEKMARLVEPAPLLRSEMSCASKKRLHLRARRREIPGSQVVRRAAAAGPLSGASRVHRSR